MNFYIVDDDISARAMLSEIIEDNDLGVVVGEAADGSLIDNSLLSLKRTDILLIDLLMPNKDGIETVKSIRSTFKGKIIMISQVETKEFINLAYTYKVEHYIMKPINNIEVITIINKVKERMAIEKFMLNIQFKIESITDLNKGFEHQEAKTSKRLFKEATIFLLSEIGVTGESGHQDLLEVLTYLFEYEKTKSFKNGFPSLRDILFELYQLDNKSETNINKEIKATEQRIRRAIMQSLDHLASLGLTDFINQKFEDYAPKFFNFTSVRYRMNELKNNQSFEQSAVQVNTRKFIQALYYEAQRLTTNNVLN